MTETNDNYNGSEDEEQLEIVGELEDVEDLSNGYDSDVERVDKESGELSKSADGDDGDDSDGVNNIGSVKAGEFPSSPGGHDRGSSHNNRSLDNALYDSMRKKLAGGASKLFQGNGSEEEQLEYESGYEEEEEEVGPNPELERGVTVRNTALGIRGQIEQLALSGASQEEAIAKGFNKRSVQTIYSDLRSKGTIKRGPRMRSSRQDSQSLDGLRIFAKGSPPEAIISAIQVPDVTNGQGVTFEQGMKFGLSIAVLGIRMAQELSGIGVQQAKPLIDMAKSMREGENAAAKSAAGEAALEAAGLVKESLMPTLMNLQQGIAPVAPSGDPMKAMMARQMEPIFGKLMSGMFSILPMGKKAASSNTLELPEHAGGDEGNISGWIRTQEDK